MGTTLVYVENDSMYRAIKNGVTFNDSTSASGFNLTNEGFGRNIVAITGGGTFENSPMSNTTLAMPSEEGYKFIGWHKDADFKTHLGDETPVVGQTYYAKWGEMTSKVTLTAAPAAFATYDPNGTSATTFSPDADCTRAEIVMFLYHAYQGKQILT